jgi:hypothetical protein
MALGVAGIKTAPDIVVNAEGVEGSIVTHQDVLQRAEREKAGVEEPGMTDSEMVQHVRQSAADLADRTLDTAAIIKTKDLRVAAAARSTARLIWTHTRGDVPPIVKELANA